MHRPSRPSAWMGPPFHNDAETIRVRALPQVRPPFLEQHLEILD